MAFGANFVFRRFPQVSKPTVRKTFALQGTQFIGIELSQATLLDIQLNVDEILNLSEEPRINLRASVYFFKRHANAEGIRDVPQALWPRISEFILDFFRIHCLKIETVNADFKTAQRF